MTTEGKTMFENKMGKRRRKKKWTNHAIVGDKYRSG
jgi:hypothetical protein